MLQKELPEKIGRQKRKMGVSISVIVNFPIIMITIITDKLIVNLVMLLIY